MPYSYNGWSASSNPSAIGIRTYTVGAGRKVPLRSSAAPILVWIANYFDKNIENIDDVLDDWGYAYRDVRGSSTALSNHASGTAIDINATHYPRGTDHMTYTKKEEVRAMVRKINHAAGKTLIKWGGEWSGAYKDQMHFELGSGTSPSDVDRAVRNLAVRPIIWVDKTIKAFVGPNHAIAPLSIARVQNRLVTLGCLTRPFIKGTAGPKTRRAMSTWQKRNGYQPDGIPGATQLAKLAGEVYRTR